MRATTRIPCAGLSAISSAKDATPIPVAIHSLFFQKRVKSAAKYDPVIFFGVCQKTTA